MRRLFSILILVSVAFIGVQPKQAQAEPILAAIVTAIWAASFTTFIVGSGLSVKDYLFDSPKKDKIRSLKDFYRKNKINDVDGFIDQYIEITGDIDWRSTFDKFDKDPTLLHAAVANNQVESTKKLLDRGANPNIVTNILIKGVRYNLTALDLALYNNNQEMADILVNAGGKKAFDLASSYTRPGEEFQFLNNKIN